MKTIFLLLLPLLPCCTNQHAETAIPKSIDSTIQQVPAADSSKVPSVINRNETRKYHTNKDSVILVIQPGDTIIYKKDDFNQVIDRHPELVSDDTGDPDLTYFSSGQGAGFNSEAGQDEYYRLYAYFLKTRNGDSKYSATRDTLIDIYQNINSLFGNFEYGGTYFGHQSIRIAAYAEYSIYLYKLNEPYGLSKTYPITAQKEFYIKSLRQLIADENSIDGNTIGAAKILRIKKLNAIVNEISAAITSNFYLRRAQEFHYRHYEYY